MSVIARCIAAFNRQHSSTFLKAFCFTYQAFLSHFYVTKARFSVYYPAKLSQQSFHPR